MSMRPFDRDEIRFRPVHERRNKFRIEDIAIDPDVTPEAVESGALDIAVDAVRNARQRGAPVVLCHGAHLIKNGLAPLAIRLVEEGWVSHVATNGAGSIHDWEFAYLGASCEDVRENVAVGEFGTWHETGAYLGLALSIGAVTGRGYGEAVGKMIVDRGLDVPGSDEIERLRDGVTAPEAPAEALTAAAAATDLLAVLAQANLAPGARVDIVHAWERHSVQAACARQGVPFTVHPGIGQDIIYTHPLFAGAAVGRTSMTDFLLYASAIAELQHGVYLSAGSSVMSPMIFEKSLSMARNVVLQDGRAIDDFTIVVNDLAESDWDWSEGEPPVDNPAYYIRFCKTFARMGGRTVYAGMDNRLFLHNLYARLRG